MTLEQEKRKMEFQMMSSMAADYGVYPFSPVQAAASVWASVDSLSAGALPLRKEALMRPNEELVNAEESVQVIIQNMFDAHQEEESDEKKAQIRDIVKDLMAISSKLLLAAEVED